MGYNKKSLLITLIIIGFVCIGVGLIISWPKESIDYSSAFDPNNTPTPNNYNIIETNISNWSTYSNPSYNFSINYPTGWKVQEYPPATQDSSFTVAFSDNELPCSTCTYFRNGYYSIKVFNEQTDPIYFKSYIELVKNTGKEGGATAVMLGENKGIMTKNSVIFQYKNFVYEISLDINEGTGSIKDSKVFENAINSFVFNKSIFEQ